MHITLTPLQREELTYYKNHGYTHIFKRNSLPNDGKYHYKWWVAKGCGDKEDNLRELQCHDYSKCNNLFGSYRCYYVIEELLKGKVRI